MEIALKHRIVGLVVLIALLAIFLPMLFQHADDQMAEKEKLSLTIPDKPKVFRMDLAGKPVVTPVTPSNVKTTKSPEAAAQNATAWVVQAGNFAKADDAQRMLRKLQGDGFTAYVQQHRAPKGKKATGALYSVYVGPILSQNDATSIEKRLQTDFHINAVLKEYQP